MSELINPDAATLEPSAQEAAAKILDGCRELTAWAMGTLRTRLPHPLMSGASDAVLKRVMGAFQTLRALIDVPALVEQARPEQARTEAAPAPKPSAPVEHRPAPKPHPDETQIHLGPHAVDHHPVDGGIKVHPAPKQAKHASQHPRAAARNH